MKANLPYTIHRHCTVSDEDDGKIWMIGGITTSVGTRSGVYYYTPSENTWTKHSDMNSASPDPACGIIKRANGDRWLLVVKGSRGKAVIRYDLTNDEGWTYISDLWENKNKYYGHMVTLNPYAPLLLGSSTAKHGTSLRNFWEFNFDNNVFEDGYYYLQNEMVWSYWTTVERSKLHRNLQNCLGFLTYAAVGWGGRTNSGWDYRHTWSVMLRKRNLFGQAKLPVSCHGKIPNLGPGKLQAGVTAIGYTIYVCGGHQYGGSWEATCYWLYTNYFQPGWNSLTSMPVARGHFNFITYAGGAFAIAGYNNEGALNRVDRYSYPGGWKQIASTPIYVHRQCSVADEGYNNIYMMGGNNGTTIMSNAYRYEVNTNRWITISSLLWVVENGGCAVMTRRANGHRIIVLVGNNEHRSQYFDLSTGGGWYSWKSSLHHQYYTRIVSVSLTESYEVNYFKANTEIINVTCLYIYMNITCVIIISIGYIQYIDCIVFI